MLRLIVGTMLAKVLTAIITLIIVVVNARFFGTNGVGTIGLLMLAVSIIQLISNFSGGGALIYLFSRYPVRPIFYISIGWSIFCSIIVTIILFYTNSIPKGLEIHVAILSLILTVYSFSTSLLISKQRIRLYNLISVSQVVFILISIIFINYFTNIKGVFVYIISIYISFSLVAVSSFLAVYQYFKINNDYNFITILKVMFKYGFFIGLASIMQLFNYRLSYFFINTYSSLSVVGIFDTATKLSEGIWLIPRSLAVIEYSKVAQSTSKEYSRQITLAFVKVAFLFSFLSVLLLILLPESMFLYIFGNQFIGIKTAILALGVGISTFSISIVLSHFFSGNGKYFHNTISSGIGLVFTVVASLIFLPNAFNESAIKGICYAGIISSSSYFFSMLYQLIVFIIVTKSKAIDFTISLKDISIVKDKLKHFRR